MPTVLKTVMMYSIAIALVLQDATSSPLTVGIPTGLMGMAFCWIIQYGIGLILSGVRTMQIVAAWFLLDSLRFVIIPAMIGALYWVTFYVFETRWNAPPR